MSAIATRLTAPEVRQLIADLVAGLGGHVADPELERLVHGIRLRAGMVALSLIQEAFVIKARGGTDDAGIKWDPLSPRTIAYGRRLGPGDPRPYRASTRYGSRPYLTDAQDRRWKRIYATRRAWLIARHGLSEEDAGARAAQIAWATLKEEGAKTKLELLGSRDVEIGRDTGRLLASLGPGTDRPQDHPLESAPAPPPDPAEVGDRILRDEPGIVIVGTNVEYAGTFHARRPLWPYDGVLPDAWQEEILDAVATGISEALVRALAA